METGITRKDIQPRETRPGIIIHHTGGGVRFVFIVYCYTLVQQTILLI